jgi:hypothetical protein
VSGFDGGGSSGRGSLRFMEKDSWPLGMTAQTASKKAVKSSEHWGRFGHARRR